MWAQLKDRLETGHRDKGPVSAKDKCPFDLTASVLAAMEQLWLKLLPRALKCQDNS